MRGGLEGSGESSVTDLRSLRVFGQSHTDGHSGALLREQSYRTPRSIAERLSPTYTKPFDVLANGAKLEAGSPVWTRNRAGGSRNLLRFDLQVSQTLCEPVNDGARITWEHSRVPACVAKEQAMRFLRILEAPPGFEPGMEVLQTGPGRLSC
jgi:hypothetical protein